MVHETVVLHCGTQNMDQQTQLTNQLSVLTHQITCLLTHQQTQTDQLTLQMGQMNQLTLQMGQLTQRVSQMQQMYYETQTMLLQALKEL